MRDRKFLYRAVTLSDNYHLPVSDGSLIVLTKYSTSHKCGGVASGIDKR
jgi:hypothetical protein